MSSLEDLHKIGGFDELARVGANQIRAHPSLIMDIIESQDDDPTFDPARARDDAMREIVGGARDDVSREIDKCIALIANIDQLLSIAFAQPCARFARAYTHTHAPSTLESLDECASAIIACVNGLIADEPFASSTIGQQYDMREHSPTSVRPGAGAREHKVAIALDVTREEARQLRAREYVQKIFRALSNARDQVAAHVEMNRRTTMA